MVNSEKNESLLRGVSNLCRAAGALGFFGEQSHGLRRGLGSFAPLALV
jgi:hypothetical protein